MASRSASSSGHSPIPVTLLSGFLGSGKTTLLRHILTSSDTDLRVAVVVNDMAALNIDATLIKKHIVSQANEDEKLIQLQNGCICCTLRGDLLEALVKMAKSGEADYIVIESTGISEPMQVAETFTEEFAAAMDAAISGESNDRQDGRKMAGIQPNDEQQIAGAEVLKEIADLGGLHNLVKLDTLVTMIDAFNFFANFSTADFISNRWGQDGGVAPEDERTVTDLMVDQIEFANCIILNKIDLVDEQARQRIRSVVQKLNPDARMLEARFASVDLHEVLATSTFDFEKAATGMGWLRSLHEMSKREINGQIRFAPKPETEEYGISSFVYQARRPFHPKRLYILIHDKFILMEDSEEDEDDEPTNDNDHETDRPMLDVDPTIDGQSSSGSSENASTVDAELWENVSDSDTEDTDSLSGAVDPKVSSHEGTKQDRRLRAEVAVDNKRNSPFAGLLRSKGFIWLATRPNLHGAWSQAGAMLTLQGGDRWFCTLDEGDWPEGEITRQSIRADFREPWGDRRQELVLIGEKLDRETLTGILDSCLLTDLEMKRWERIMRRQIAPDKIQSKLEVVFEDGFMDWVDPQDIIDDHGHHH